MLEWFARRYEQVKRLAPLISLTLQSATLATLVYGLVSWRGIGYWIIPAIFVAIITATTLCAWIYYVPLDMKRHERLAQMELNPIESDILFSPKEAWAWTQLAYLVAGEKTLEEYQHDLKGKILERRSRKR